MPKRSFKRFVLHTLMGQSLVRKVLFIVTLILFLISCGTLIGYFMFKVPVGEAVWWAWTHLIDPGFLGDDKDDPARRIIGTLFALIGMIVIAGTFIAILEDIGRRTVERMRKGSIPSDMHGHTVLVGSGKKLPHFVDALKRLPDPAEDEGIVIVVPEQSMLDDARRLCQGPEHFIADHIWEDKGIGRLKLQNAQRIILLDNFGGTNGDMLSFLFKLQELRKEKIEKTDTKIYLEINNRKLLDAITFHVERLRADDKKTEIHTINMADAAARLLLRNHPLDCIPSAPVTLIIIGWSEFADALLQQAIRVAHYAIKPTRIIVATKDVDLIEAKIKTEMPGLDGNEYARSILNIGFVESFILGQQELTDTDAITLAVCGDNADNVFSDAVRWQQATRLPGLRQIYLELPDGSGYRDVIEKVPDDPAVPRLVAAGSRSDAFRLAEEMDRVARALHQKYLKQRGEQNKRDPLKNMQDRDWENLDETTRGWNRAPVDHMMIKLRALADHFLIQRHSAARDGSVLLDEALSAQVRNIVEHIQGKLPEQRLEIELLAGMEHDRWSAEKIAQGWRYAPAKNADLRQSPYLVSYECLDETTKQYDRETIAEILETCVKGEK